MKRFLEEYGIIFGAICIVVALLMAPLISPSSQRASMSQHSEDSQAESLVESQAVLQQGQWMLLFGLLK